MAKSKIERDFPWLAIHMLADRANRVHETKDVTLAGLTERDISDAMAKMLMAEYLKNVEFAAYLRATEAAGNSLLAMESMITWLKYAAFHVAFHKVTGRHAIDMGVL